MTTSLLDVPPGWPPGTDVVGSQRPRIYSVPPYLTTAGAEAIEVCELAGLDLDPWQQLALIDMLAEAATWKCPRCPYLAPAGDRGRCPAHTRASLFHPWAAFEAALVVNRQNGKGSILEGRELTGLFLLEERLLIHSAHQYDTSMEAFSRLLERIEDTPDFDARVQRVVRSHGEEGIELNKPRRRIRFRTRTKGGGKGFTADCVILDEAQILSATMVGALIPTLSTRPNPQIIYTANAVDQQNNENGAVLASVRQRGIAGTDPALMYHEYSVSVPLDKLLNGTPEERATLDAPAAWAEANPALGYRISLDYIAKERRAMPRRQFCVERLGAGDYPDPDEGADRLIPAASWRALVDPDSTPEGRICLAVDVTPDHGMACIAAAGKRADGNRHVEITGTPEQSDHRAGTGWVAARLLHLRDTHRPAAIILDPAGAAGSLLAEMARLGLRVRDKDHPSGDIVTVTAREHAQACGMLYDSVIQAAGSPPPTLRHLGTSELAAAVDGAKKRPLGDAWAWDRKTSAVDISPLVAGTLALWGSETQTKRPRSRVINLANV